MQRYGQAQSAYAQSAGEINENLAAFRGRVDTVKSANKSLKEQAEQTIDLNALKGIGEEAAVRALKTYGGKALSAVDNKLFSGRVTSDTEGLKNMITKRIQPTIDDVKSKVSDAVEDVKSKLSNIGDDVGQRASNIASDISDRVGSAGKDVMNAAQDLKTRGMRAVRGGEEGDGSIEMQGSTTEVPKGTEMTQPLETKVEDDDGNPVRREDMDDAGKSRFDGMETKDEEPPELENDAGGDMDFDTFMSKFNSDLPRTETGDIDFAKVDDQTGMIQEDYSGKSLQKEGQGEAAENEQMGQEDTRITERSNQASEREGMGTEDQDVGIDHPLDDNPNNTFTASDDTTADLDDTAKSALKSTAGDADADALADLGETGAEEGGESAVAGGLEGAGTALDATGIGAVIGVPLQIAGAVLEGGAIVEAAKGVWDWFDDDILGNHPKPPTLAMPKATPTLAQRGYLVTPDMSSLDEQTSYGGSF